MACSLHPGVIVDGSDLWRHAGDVMKGNKTVAQGAATSVYCCVAPDIASGAYYNDCARSSAAGMYIQQHNNDTVRIRMLWMLCPSMFDSPSCFLRVSCALLCTKHKRLRNGFITSRKTVESNGSVGASLARVDIMPTIFFSLRMVL
jgi:hypothetical protein